MENEPSESPNHCAQQRSAASINTATVGVVLGDQESDRPGRRAVARHGPCRSDSRRREVSKLERGHSRASASRVDWPLRLGDADEPTQELHGLQGAEVGRIGPWPSPGSISTFANRIQRLLEPEVTSTVRRHRPAARRSPTAQSRSSCGSPSRRSEVCGSAPQSSKHPPGGARAAPARLMTSGRERLNASGRGSPMTSSPAPAPPAGPSCRPRRRPPVRTCSHRPPTSWTAIFRTAPAVPRPAPRAAGHAPCSEMPARCATSAWPAHRPSIHSAAACPRPCCPAANSYRQGWTSSRGREDGDEGDHLAGDLSPKLRVRA